MAELSPMMKQYFKIKDKHKDTLLFYRLGDFYEMFFDDAKIASKELELTLTGRDCGQKERAPMCGVPYHSCDAYIARLIKKGYKVAICEQKNDNSNEKTKNLMEREVVRVITPGTVIESSMLDEGKNNYIASLFLSKTTAGLSFCDISTGEVHATYLKGKDIIPYIQNELVKFFPSEFLIAGDIKKFKELDGFIKERLNTLVNVIETEASDSYENEVLRQFKLDNLESINANGKDDLVLSLYYLINYLKRTQKAGIERLTTIDIYTGSQFMSLDVNSRRNLELTETIRSNEKKGSLLWVLDHTKTAMGKRLIKSWIEQPLLDLTKILKRQNAVNELVTDIMLKDSIREKLQGIYDLERLMTKIVYGSANARELRSLCYTLLNLPSVKDELRNVQSELLKEIKDGIDTLSDVSVMIDNALVDEPPISIKDGNIIKPGYNKELDSLRDALYNGKELIAEIEAREKEKTKIPKLKISYNKVYGYYIEVSNSYKDKVPSDYIRKQTLVNCERFITEELKELEGRILNAKERSTNLEYDIFSNVRKQVSENLNRIQKTAMNIAKLDVLASLAYVAYESNYVCPLVDNSSKIEIKDGRHPVVEKLTKSSIFTPNDTSLDSEANRLLIITGPNMAGKSTYMRQTALITLMAQIGSFVPAKSAQIGIVDSIFTRVGASDDLASGQSTFMVEMMEVADIMKNATKDSLIILDEIGRGTSTFDGMSLARAVVEYTCDKKKLGAKTLFATHYHELTELEKCFDGVKNYNIAVKKRGDDIVFLRKIIPGGADDSYGIEVAKLAGVPNWIIERAKQVLVELEGSNNLSLIVPKNIEKNEGQISLSDYKEHEIIDKLKSIDVTTLTPIEAIGILFDLTTMAKK